MSFVETLDQSTKGFFMFDREAHCEMCGRHYFAGLQGFPCDCQPSPVDSWDEEETSDESD